MSKFRYVAAFVACVCTAGVGNCRTVDVADEAAFLSRLLDGQAIAVASVNVAAIDAKEALKELRRITGDKLMFTEEEGKITGALASLTECGVTQVHLVFSMADLPQAPPVVAFRLKPGSDVAAARRAIAALKINGHNPLAESTLATHGDALVAGSAAIHKRIEGLKGDERAGLKEALAIVGKAPVRLLFIPNADVRRVLTEMFPELPKPFDGEAGRTFGQSLQWAIVGVNVEQGKLVLEANVKAADAAAAAKMNTLIGEVVKALPGLLASAPDSTAVIGALISRLHVKAVDDRVVVSLGDTQDKAATGELAQLFAGARSSAARAQSVNNLKQLALAMHIHHDANKAFPSTAIRSKDGKPLLSWRVAVLPYLDANKLYKEFKLDEPWDSEHNLKLLAKMPEVYRLPTSAVGKQGKTCFLAVGGPLGIIGDKPVRIQEITDGTSNTILIAEVDDAHAVPWTKPDDIVVAEGSTITGLGGHFKGVFVAAFGDGSVRTLSTSTSAQQLRALMTKAGGEVIELH